MAELVEWLFLLGRLGFGGFFIYNGINHFLNREQLEAYAQSKDVPSPSLMVPGTGVVLLAGGAGVLLGVFPHASLGLLLAFLVPVTLRMHAFWTIDDEQARSSDKTQFAKNVALIGACLAFFVIPVPWDFALL